MTRKTQCIASFAGESGLCRCLSSVTLKLSFLIELPRDSRHCGYHSEETFATTQSELMEKIMNHLSRREKIEAMLADEPGDVFLRYSLAMELSKEGDHTRSLELLDELTAGQPPYVPAYFMSAQQLAGLQRVDEARTSLRDGIEEARKQGDTHAAGEMSEFLASLGSAG